jgi:hypothetical protein
MRPALLILAAVCFAVASCSLPMNEEPPAPISPETNIGFSSQCLDNALPVMKGFLDGTAHPKDVAETWDCFGGAIDLFYRKVKGSNQNAYAPREIAQFFEDYFLKKVHINDRLLNEIMHIKQVFVGGRADQITKDELKKLTAFAHEARDLSIQLLPYMKVFSQNWKPGGRGRLADDIDFFDQANQEVQHVAKRLGDRIASNNQDYRLDDLLVLLDELQGVYGEQWTWLTELRKTFPLVHKLKKSLVGGLEEVVRASEWRRFGLLGARGYVQYLRYYYFIKNAPEDTSGLDIIYITKSIDDLFSYLGDMVREKTEAKFTKGELQEILTALKAIFPKVDISPALLDESMKIKQVFFGGNTEEFVPEEFEKARTKVEAFRGLTQCVYGYLNFYTMDWRAEDMSPADAQKYFQEGEANLLELGTRLGQIMETQYDLRDISKFAHELSKLFPPQPGEPTSGEKVDKYLPMLISGKNILMDDSNTVVLRTQWSDFLKSGAELYCRFLYYRYFVEKKDLLEGAGVEALSRFTRDVTVSVDHILERRDKRGDPVVHFSELDRFVDAVETSNMLPSSFPAKVLKPVLRVLFQKFLVRPALRLSGKVPDGLSAEATWVVRNELGSWVEGQNLISLLYNSVPGGEGLSGSEILKYMQSVKETEVLREFKMSLNTPVPLTFDSLGRLYLSKSKPILYSRRSLAKINLARLLVRLVNNGYIGEQKRIDQYLGITKAEANALFADAKPLVVPLGLIEESNTTFADNRFREANLFAPHADGNDLMNFKEAVDLVLLILSGLELDGSMKKAFRQSCDVIPAQPERDERITLRCFLDVYRNHQVRLFTSMPEFSVYAAKLNQEDFDKMMINFLKATGWEDDKTGTVKLGDTALVPHVIQYAETTMSKFDFDKNGFLDRIEALDAYPVFRSTLLSVGKINNDKILKGAFAYILVKGKIPDSIGEQLQFIAVWIHQEKKWPIWVDRKRLADTLGYIADAVAKGGGKLPNMQLPGQIPGTEIDPGPNLPNDPRPAEQ